MQTRELINSAGMSCELAISTFEKYLLWELETYDDIDRPMISDFKFQNRKRRDIHPGYLFTRACRKLLPFQLLGV